ncbi:MAG: hypothetical protein K1X28_07185 [Parachlamydiales bacterium]|nr:hypothetical protein [Parachlamydiales bacterium]
MHILGVHLDYPFLRISRIRKTQKGIVLDWNKTALLTAEDENQEALSFPNVKRLYIENFAGKVVSGLSPKDFLVRQLDVKISSQKHVEKAIAFQSEALSHFKPGEVITVPLVEKKEKGKAEALLFTVPREALKKHLDDLKKIEIDPDIVSTIPSALCHFFRWKFPKLNEALIIDLGSSVITCAYMENGQLKKAHAIPTGIEELLGALYEDRKRILLKNEIEGAAKQIDLLLLKSQLNPHLSNELNALKQEIAKIDYSFSRGLNKPILFTGRSDAFIHLREFLADFSDAEWPLSIEEQKSAISLGLCIEQTQKKALQLRREEFFPERNWTRMGRIALILIASSIAISATLAGLGMQAAKKSKEQMLHAIQTPLRKNLIADGSVEEQIDQWIDAIEKNNQEYPYILQAPKVTEVLSWLSSHPLLKEMKQEGDPIDIQEFRVQLVKFPTNRSEKDPYLAKAELEFRFKSMMNARRFHEALREGDAMVNPNLEITWEVLHDGYRTSFFLKNRSPYVP